MSELDNARAKIDEINQKMVALFLERMEQSRIIGEYKKANGLPVKNLARETQIIETLLADCPANMKPYLEDFFQDIFRISCDYQEKL